MVLGVEGTGHYRWDAEVRDPTPGGLFPNLEGHYASEEFYLQIKGQSFLEGNIKVGMSKKPGLFFPFTHRYNC